MSPTLRSSNPAQNSPNSKAGSATNTPRKTPSCTKCGRPRVGHPRSGCPYLESSKATSISKDLSAVLETLDLEDSGSRRRRQPVPLQRTDTVISLPATSSEIVEGLLKPRGVFDRAPKVVHWADTIVSPPVSAPAAGPVAGTRRRTQRQPRALMPCTLIPPSPNSSTQSLPVIVKPEPEPEDVFGGGSVGAQEQQQQQWQSGTSSEEIAPSASSSTSQQQPRPLGRSMSSLERDLFLSRISQEALATVYIVPNEDLPNLTAEAAALQFSVHFRPASTDGDNALMIVGRNESAVEALNRKIQARDEEICRSRGQPEGSITRIVKYTGVAAAAGVASWAGLAFT